MIIDVQRDVIKSLTSSTSYKVRWHSLVANHPDHPLISIQDSGTQLIYSESNNIYIKDLISKHGGVCVWVRDSASTQPLQTLYTVNFPESTCTKCDMLIVGNSKYRYLTDVSLNGMYDTYTLPKVIIRYKDTKKISTPYTPSGLLKYKDSNWVVNDYPELNDIPGLLSFYIIASVPTIPANFNQLSGTIPYSSITSTPSIPAAATFSSLNPVNICHKQVIIKSVSIMSIMEQHILQLLGIILLFGKIQMDLNYEIKKKCYFRN